MAGVQPFALYLCQGAGKLRLRERVAAWNGNNPVAYQQHAMVGCCCRAKKQLSDVKYASYAARSTLMLHQMQYFT